MRWLARRLRYLLTNINYTGDCLTNKTVTLAGKKCKVNNGEQTQYLIEGHHEPIVSKEIFAKVQEMLKSGALTPQENQYTIRSVEVQMA